MLPNLWAFASNDAKSPTLIIGQGKYVGDLQFDNMLHMTILRSPYGHANIRSIDTNAAAALPGVVAVLTGDGINPHLAEPLPMIIPFDDAYSDNLDLPRYPLTTDKARHVGDLVAVVIAESPYIADDALSLINVDYEICQQLSILRKS